MAEQYAYFYNADQDQNGEWDREYDADSMSEWLKKFFTTGVFVGDLFVSSNNNMTVSVGSGYCNVGGKVKFFEPKTLTLDTADATLDRIDLIVAERNDTERDFFIKVVQGGSSSNPVAPALVRNGVIYQLCLAQIYVSAGMIRVTQANITDTRGITALCGYVTGTVEEIDFTQITQQFNTFFAKYRADVEENYAEYERRLNELEQQSQLDLSGALAAIRSEFNSWFDQIKDQLGTDAAGHLQNELNEQDSRLSLLEYMVIKDDIFAPIDLNETGSGDPVLLVDESGRAILADWKYEKV